MVTNVTSLPSFVTPTATQPRAPAAVETDKAPRVSASAVDIDPANLEYHDDVVAAREDVADARDAIHFAIATAREARGFLLEARDLALRAADADTPDAARAAQDVGFRSVLQQLGKLVDGAIAAGAPLVAGDTLSVEADPDSPVTLEVGGLDLRVKASVNGDEAVLLTRTSTIADRSNALEAARAADQSVANVDAGLRRLDGESGRLAQHDRILGALDASLISNVRVDLDADGARLLALQVRQDLSQATAPIASARPNAVLSFFRE